MLSHQTLNSELQDRADAVVEASNRYLEAVQNLQLGRFRVDVIVEALEFDVSRGLGRNTEQGVRSAELGLDGALSTVIDAFREQIGCKVGKLAELGGWRESLGTAWIMQRIPGSGATPSLGDPAPGWNSVMAVALGLVDGNEAREFLAALVHPSCFTEERVRTIQQHIADSIDELAPESPTAQWLASFGIESDAPVNQLEFLEQVAEFEGMVFNLPLRKRGAISGYSKLRSTFSTHEALPPDIPIGRHPWCTQAAYVHGHPLAVRRSEAGYFALETFREDGLGLENFSWGSPPAEANYCNGPVDGSTQHVICSDLNELQDALGHLRRKFASELKLVESS